jgi:hypothetical protein
MQPCVLSLIDHAHPAATEFLDNPVVRDGLVDHYVDASFLVASSYGRGAGQSMKTVLARPASRTLPFLIGVLSGPRTHTAIQDKKDHEWIVAYAEVVQIGICGSIMIMEVIVTTGDARPEADRERQIECRSPVASKEEEANFQEKLRSSQSFGEE